MAGNDLSFDLWSLALPLVSYLAKSRCPLQSLHEECLPLVWLELSPRDIS